MFAVQQKYYLKEKMINLPNKKQKDKTHCTDCDIKLTKETQKVYGGVKYGQCKKCIIKKQKKHNDKRQKAIKDNKWF